MAQLVKCRDYVSRYEQNLKRYVNQFISNKSRRWNAFKSKHSEEEKGLFYERLFNHQLIWASSTSLRRSNGIVGLKHDEVLKDVLKWFGDTGLLFYRPVLKLDQVEVETDLILITPTTIWVMVYLKGEKGSVFQEQSRRQWTEVRSGEIRTLVNPLLSLARSTEVVKQCLGRMSERLPIRSVLMVPESFVEFSEPGRGVQILDQSLFPAWLKTVEPYRAAFKNLQLRCVETLLNHSITEAELR